MGKVLEKLAKLPAVKSLAEVEGGIMVVLNSGPDKLCKTAHEARLFIQEHSGKAPRKGKLAVVAVDGEAVPQPVFVAEVPRYPGMRKAAERAGEDYVPRPIWEVDKGFNSNEAEGRDAFRRGYERKSHGYGESSAAKEFEQAWDAAKRSAERVAAEAASLDIAKAA